MLSKGRLSFILLHFKSQPWAQCDWYFVNLLLGMISRIFFADELACISPEHCTEVCGSPAGCSNVAYPRLVMSVMPLGLRGLIMAVMIAALMSDLDSIFNSASTIFTLDIYKMLRKQVSSRELVIVGRLFVLFMVAISIAWVPVVIAMQGGQMFYYIQEVSDYLTPPIAAIFLLGVLWHRCNETGAFWGGMVGFILGASRLILALVYREPHCSQPDERPSFIKDIHFMYVAAILFWVSGSVAVVVSLCTAPPGKEQISTTTLWGLRRRKNLRRQEKENGDTEVLALKPFNSAVLDQNGFLRNENHQYEPVDSNGIQPNGKGTQANSIDVFADSQRQNSHFHTPSAKTAQGESMVEEWGCWREGVQGGRCTRALEWFCGLQEKPTNEQVVSLQEQQKKLDELLHETTQNKVVLNIALVLVASVAIFLFIYFSV